LFGECSWHEQLLLKVHSYNEHVREVAEAEQIIEDGGAYAETEQETDPEKLKKAAEEHARKLEMFWGKADSEGSFYIQKAAMITREWAEQHGEAEAKTEAEK